MGEKYNLDFDDDDDEQVNYPPDLNDEILQAPWNTTRAYLGALKGKCLMQVFGIGGREYFPKIFKPTPFNSSQNFAENKSKIERFARGC